MSKKKFIFNENKINENLKIISNEIEEYLENEVFETNHNLDSFSSEVFNFDYENEIHEGAKEILKRISFLTLKRFWNHTTIKNIFDLIEDEESIKIIKSLDKIHKHFLILNIKEIKDFDSSLEYLKTLINKHYYKKTK